MQKRRLTIFLLFCSAGMIALAGRLMEIQLLNTEAFSKRHINLLEESVKQRSQQLVIDNGRGHFLDRNRVQLTDKKVSVLVLFPFLKEMSWEASRIAAILNIPAAHLKTAVNNAKGPFFYGGERTPYELTALQAKQINALKIPGAFAVEKRVARSNIPAEQLIGIVGENPMEISKRYPGYQLSEKTPIGISGLEQSFDKFLLSDGKTKLIYNIDGLAAPLFGRRVMYSDPANPFYPVNIRTTIDKNIQEKAEKLADSFHIKKGGLVLLDVKDNSIVAMVSRPVMDKTNPYKGNGITNMMVKQQIIGSVFKTVTAAAAIDYNLVSSSRLFDCSKKINGEVDYTYHYGMLNFPDSFSRSCNQTFGLLAQELSRMNPEILADYAAKLSLTGPVGWSGDVNHARHFKQLSDEETGRVFLKGTDVKDALLAAQTGIGQHEVRATPLAVANMMATIARGGKKESVQAVSKIEFKNGTTMFTFQRKDLPGGTISPYTAIKLQQLLRGVVVNAHGTGKGLRHLPYEVAGKSGTAETGKYQHGQQLHNKWFAGYFPYHQPKYALAVVNLDVTGNEGGVNQLFAKIVEMLYVRDQSL